jgi:hypothetical protein
VPRTLASRVTHYTLHDYPRVDLTVSVVSEGRSIHSLLCGVRSREDTAAPGSNTIVVWKDWHPVQSIQGGTRPMPTSKPAGSFAGDVVGGMAPSLALLKWPSKIAAEAPS